MSQRVYLNGILDGVRTAKNAYYGTYGNTNIGYNPAMPKSSWFSGT